jgi:hypothetical protein
MSFPLASHNGKEGMGTSKLNNPYIEKLSESELEQLVGRWAEFEQMCEAGGILCAYAVIRAYAVLEWLMDGFDGYPSRLRFVRDHNSIFLDSWSVESAIYFRNDLVHDHDIVLPNEERCRKAFIALRRAVYDLGLPIPEPSLDG